MLLALALPTWKSAISMDEVQPEVSWSMLNEMVPRLGIEMVPRLGIKRTNNVDF